MEPQTTLVDPPYTLKQLSNNYTYNESNTPQENVVEFITKCFEKSNWASKKFNKKTSIFKTLVAATLGENDFLKLKQNMLKNEYTYQKTKWKPR